MRKQKKVRKERCSCGCLRVPVEESRGAVESSRRRKEWLFAAVPLVVLLGFTAIAWTLNAPEKTEGASREDAEVVASQSR